MVRVGVSQKSEQGWESGRGSGESRAEMEQDKGVGHEMDSTGNTVGWKGDDEGKVRKAFM